MKTILVFTLLLSIAFVVGCDSDNGGAELKKYYAGKDSRFTYKRTDKTPQGNPDPASDTTVEAIVLEGVHAFKGKDSVITVVAGRDTTRIAYETNGDISIYSGAGFFNSPIPLPFTIPDWGTLPVKSKGQVPILSQDLNIEVDLGGFLLKIVKVVGTAMFMTDEEITVGSERLKSSKVKVDFLVSYQFGFPITSIYTVSTSYWYSEKVGYFSKVETSNDQIPVGNVDPGNYIQVLTSYSAK
jgi:hypothetical protein